MNDDIENHNIFYPWFLAFTVIIPLIFSLFFGGLFVFGDGYMLIRDNWRHEAIGYAFNMALVFNTILIFACIAFGFQTVYRLGQKNPKYKISWLKSFLCACLTGVPSYLLCKTFIYAFYYIKYKEIPGFILDIFK